MLQALGISNGYVSRYGIIHTVKSSFKDKSILPTTLEEQNSLSRKTALLLSVDWSVREALVNCNNDYVKSGTNTRHKQWIVIEAKTWLLS